MTDKVDQTVLYSISLTPCSCFQLPVAALCMSVCSRTLLVLWCSRSRMRLGCPLWQPHLKLVTNKLVVVYWTATCYCINLNSSCLVLCSSFSGWPIL
eukprot:jgi/Chrzof1/4695/Cz14g23050.t1